MVSRVDFASRIRFEKIWTTVRNLPFYYLYSIVFVCQQKIPIKKNKLRIPEKMTKYPYEAVQDYLPLGPTLNRYRVMMKNLSRKLISQWKADNPNVRKHGDGIYASVMSDLLARIESQCLYRALHYVIEDLPYESVRIILMLDGFLVHRPSNNDVHT